MRNIEEVYVELSGIMRSLLVAYTAPVKYSLYPEPEPFTRTSPEISKLLDDLQRVLREVLDEHIDELVIHSAKFSRITSVIGVMGKCKDEILKIHLASG